jgi:hypothetical protein
VRTIKLCASSNTRLGATAGRHQTTLMEAIRRSAVEIERSGHLRRPLPVPAGHTAAALA